MCILLYLLDIPLIFFNINSWIIVEMFVILNNTSFFGNFFILKYLKKLYTFFSFLGNFH
jgi:hypothetical protein